MPPIKPVGLLIPIALSKQTALYPIDDKKVKGRAGVYEKWLFLRGF
jgi:hypothetical protein